MTMGIYLISDSLSQKVYVGASISLEERLAVHKRRLEQGSHPNKRMQEAFDPEHFSFAILEEVESEELIKQREGFYIELFKSYEEESGFNLTAYSGYSARRSRTQVDPLGTLKAYQEQLEHLRMSLREKLIETHSLKQEVLDLKTENKRLIGKHDDLVRKINRSPIIKQALIQHKKEEDEKAARALEDMTVLR